MSGNCLTVFTPTYNRAYVLGNLYESLCRQSCKDFCWLIVDDGSDDNTKQLVESWIEKGKVRIKYFFQENSGKSMAHNKGVDECTTEYFICVDSDDYLTDDAVEIILNGWQKAIDDSSVGALLAFRKDSIGHSISKYNNSQEVIKGTLKGFYQAGIISGDTALTFKTEILKKLKFPCFAGEKFVPEAYIYDQFDRNYNFFIIPEHIVVCEYLEDGYTTDMAKIIANNPQGYLAYIQQRLMWDEKIKEKVADTIRYVAIMYCISRKRIIGEAKYKILAFLVKPLGYYMYCSRYAKKIGKV